MMCEDHGAVNLRMSLRRVALIFVVVVLSGCAAILGLDPPTFDTTLDVPDGRGTDDATTDATATEGGALGTIDPTFGDAGVVTIDFGGDDVANAVVVLPDGKILV